MSIPIDFKSQIDTLKQQYPGYLDNFKQYYILTKQFPTDDSYTRGYECSRGNMQKATKDLFLINNNIQSEIEKLKANTLILNRNILDKKTQKVVLQTKHTDAIREVNGAQTMISDYKKIYVLQYISNVSIFIGIIFAGVLISKTFRRPTMLP